MGKRAARGTAPLTTNDTGERSTPSSAVIAMPSISRDSRASRPATAKPATATAAAITSHAAPGAWPGRNTLISMPRSDWLDVPALDPSRPGSKITLVQYVTESRGSSSQAPSVQAAAVISAASAVRRRPESQRYTMKTPGTSLIAAARPTRTPRGQRGARAAQSATAIANSTMSTWPNRISSRSGNRYAQPANRAANTAARRPGAGTRRSSGAKAYQITTTSGT